MPPKPKHTREEIIAAGAEIVREKGMDSLSSRELGARLGTTARPIFTAFENMEELQNEVRKEIFIRFKMFGKENSEDLPSYTKYGIMLISFATKEPKLFQALFMREQSDLHSIEKKYTVLKEAANRCIQEAVKDFAITEAQAKLLFDQLWIYTYGIAAMCALHVCSFTDKEILERITNQTQGMLRLIRN